jgi:hypothetical protein
MSFLSQHDVQQILRRVESIDAPVLSLYVPVDPSVPGAGGRGALVRIRKALAASGAPSGLAERVAGAARELVAVAGTAALIAGEDEMISLRIDEVLPVVFDSTGELEASWGPPLRGPLYLALTAHRYAAVVVDSTAVSCFELFAGSADELWTEQRAGVPGQGDQVESSKQIHPAYVASRGGHARDAADDHDAAWTEHLYRTAAERLVRTMTERAIDRLILIGTSASEHQLADHLPDRLRDRIAAELPALSAAAPGPAQVTEHCRDAVDEAERRRISDLVDAIAGPQSVSGVDAAESALEMARLGRLVLSWRLPVAQREGLIAGALARGAEVALATGELADRLMRDHGGVVAERRW